MKSWKEDEAKRARSLENAEDTCAKTTLTPCQTTHPRQQKSTDPNACASSPDMLAIQPETNLKVTSFAFPQRE